MKCEKCTFAEKSYYTDTYGNMHITWYCKKRYFLLYHQVNYTDQFLSNLRSGALFNGDVQLYDVLPRNKDFKDVQTVEVLFKRGIVDCKHYRAKCSTLDAWIPKPQSLNTTNV